MLLWRTDMPNRLACILKKLNNCLFEECGLKRFCDENLALWRGSQRGLLRFWFRCACGFDIEDFHIKKKFFAGQGVVEI